jgi:hypothetical protein
MIEFGLSNRLFCNYKFRNHLIQQVYHLDNGSFFMAPDSDHDFALSSPNGCSGRLSPEAFGIVICLLAYSQLCFGTPSGFTETCAEHFHGLRRYALGHPVPKSFWDSSKEFSDDLEAHLKRSKLDMLEKM